MRCPACGVDVVEKAIFCHKCGERIDAMGEPDLGQTQPADSVASPGEASAPPANPLKPAANGESKNEPEKDVWRGGYSPKAMIGGWVLSVVITLLLLIAGVLWVRTAFYWVLLLILIIVPWAYHLILLTYRRMSVHYLLTTQRVIHESGILRRVTNRIEAIDMDDITFEQSVFERLMGTGTIRILSTDRTHPQLELIGIENVKHVAEMFDEVRCKERRSRGIHIEQI